jgi:hypothetical protein
VPVRTEHGVERRVLEWQLLHVAFPPFDADTGELSVLASAFEQLQCEIERADLRPQACGRDCHDPRSTRDIQHALARGDGRLRT